MARRLPQPTAPELTVPNARTATLPSGAAWSASAGLPHARACALAAARPATREGGRARGRRLATGRRAARARCRSGRQSPRSRRMVRRRDAGADALRASGAEVERWDAAPDLEAVVRLGVAIFSSVGAAPGPRAARRRPSSRAHEGRPAGGGAPERRPDTHATLDGAEQRLGAVERVTIRSGVVHTFRNGLPDQPLVLRGDGAAMARLAPITP